MKFADLTDLAARNLRESLLRNSLTTLGITVGVASLVAMLSLGVGLQNMINQRLARNGLFDSILVQPRNPLEERRQRSGRLFDGPRVAAVRPQPLDQAAREALARLPGVVEVYPQYRFTADVRYGDAGEVIRVQSLPPSAAATDAIAAVQGSFFSSPNAKEIILQAGVARDLAARHGLAVSDLLGKDVTLRYAGRQMPAPDAEASLTPDEGALGFTIVSSRISLRVVGIIDAEAVPTGAVGFRRSGAYVPLKVAEGLGIVQGDDMGEIMVSNLAAGGENEYENLTVRVANPALIPAVQQQITELGFTAFSLLDVTQNLSRMFAIFDLLLGIFGSLALAVASLGIVNTLVMAIFERRREIGVLKALGASDRDVRQIFFAEAGAMGLAGGLAGVALGWAIGRAIQFATTIYLERRGVPAEDIWSVPWWLVAGAIAFSLFVSLIAGIYPASRAAKLDPVQALRYE